MTTLFTRAIDIMSAPRARLQSDFPWTLRKMGHTYLIASLWFYAGSVTLPLAFMGFVFLAPHISNDLFLWLANMLDGGKGVADLRFIVLMSAVSFFSGFGAELLYLRHVLHRSGGTLRGTMSLHFDALRGKTGWHTAGSVLWRVAVAWGLWFALELTVTGFFGHAPQDTVNLFRASSGIDFAVLAVMAVIGAPICEELVFRGFLQNAVSSSLKHGRALSLLKGNTLVAEYLAGAVSASIFALMHMQFHPVTLLLLFALGFIHAELYRRSGSLYCSMLLHFVNNGIAVGVMLYAKL